MGNNRDEWLSHSRKDRQSSVIPTGQDIKSLTTSRESVTSSQGFEPFQWQWQRGATPLRPLTHRKDGRDE